MREALRVCEEYEATRARHRAAMEQQRVRKGDLDILRLNNQAAGWRSLGLRAALAAEEGEQGALLSEKENWLRRLEQLGGVRR
jgi:hypothetical protein